MAFMAANCGEVKWAMDKRVGVGEVDVLAEWKEVVMRGVCLRCVGRPVEVRVRRRARAHQVRPRMITKPKALIRSIHA